ncbi:MAG TPA: hypothetical protein VFQ53_14420 [Kofleriaceae bacterium]|nr:hypothetical protein [Kofleriaceae bacterium]
MPDRRDSTDELPDVPALRMLEPPPGGLALLRARLDRPRRRWLLAVPALAAIALVLLVIARPPPIAQPAPPPSLLRDPAIASDVDFYWAASTPGRQRAGSSVVPIDEVPIVREVRQ